MYLTYSRRGKRRRKKRREGENIDRSIYSRTESVNPWRASPRASAEAPRTWSTAALFRVFIFCLCATRSTAYPVFLLPSSLTLTDIRAVHSVLRLQSSYRPDRARARAFPSSTSSSELQFKSLNGGRRLRMDMPNVHDEKPKVRVCMRHVRLCS